MNRLNERGRLAALAAWLTVFSVDALFILDDGLGILSGAVMAALIVAAGHALAKYLTEKY